MGQTMKHKAKKKTVKRKGRLKRLLPYLAIILVAAALVAAVILVTNRNGFNEDNLPSAVELERDTKEEIQNNRMEKDTNPAIAQIVQRYFQAAKTADADTLNQIVETDVPFDAERLKQESEYIESYSNISCYSIDGIVDNTYIVYVYFEYKFLSIETKAPSLIRFYICENPDGTMYINNRAWDGEVSTYMQEVANWQEVRDLNTEVNNKYKAALDADEKLKQFCAMLNGEL